MRINLKFDFNILSKKVLCQQLDAMGLQYTIQGLGEVEIEKMPDDISLKTIEEALCRYGIEIISDQQMALVQRIKDAITVLINDENNYKKYNVSTYLSEKLDYSYAYISNIFSETTYTSIENFVILKKIDIAKSHIVENHLTLTEIAYKLNYSSVAHLSAQFKKTTGLTPSTFQKIIKKRKERKMTP
tara:strand:+ start:101954 stop:102514 length:561 start_codon:yes stop_codon:yes gene_type:complete